jgi:chromosome segregation protein
MTQSKTSITKITVQGFKSFNKRIAIPLLNGFNIVCGPNGSGKSNIVDAICFVLGRTSAKSLRADRLHELIFHGGEGRKPADVAAVSLYLDNTKKLFPFEDEEVFVTRKVNKKGVSIYKIHGRTTTREKVLEMLSSAYIYPDGHNIVLQGDVTNIIEMNPIERRFIIDEISGIAEYNERRDKAKRDLEVVDQKLKEAEIVITERYDIFKKLEEERNAAIKYQQLQQELLVLKASLAYSKLRENEAILGQINADLEKKQQMSKDLQKEVETVEGELEKRERGIQELASRVVEFSRRMETEKEISFLRTKIMMNKDRIDANKTEMLRLNSLIARLSEIESKTEEPWQLPRAVRAVLDQKIKGVHGTVGSVVKTQAKYQVAIEVTAGPHMNDVIVENEDVAKFCIDFLKREKIGRATFLPLNKIRARDVEADVIGKSGVFGIASNLMQYDKKYEKAVEFVFGGTVVIDNLDTAKAIGIGKARMVSLDGDLVERTGAMIGGFYYRVHPQLAKATAKDEISEYKELRNKLEQEIKELEHEIEQFEKNLEKYGESAEIKKIVDMEKLQVDSQQVIDEMRQKRKMLYEKRLAVQSELNQFSIQKARIEADLENVRIEIQQYGDVKPVERAVRTLQPKLREVEKQLETIGAVNFKSIEQYDRFKNEFDQYKMKYEKILEEKKAVLGMIEKIEEKRREVFYKCLQEISGYFNEIFEKMTNGSAKLELENSLDLESGLIIEANPEGKMLLNIDSMSGGEKTLTALAFLFSVQKYRPAPFYILDEVDAALDKANSKKVADLIKLMSKEEQFIVITHNDTTIMYGDRVYGVTMNRGESKILSLELPNK